MEKILQKISTIQKWLSLKKNAVNEYLHNKYITLDSIIDALEKPMADNQLFMYHNIVNRELITHIYDFDNKGEVISSFPMNATDPQRVGSEITYWKRYNLSAIFNIIADEDDDWNKSSNIDIKNAPKTSVTPKTGKTTSNTTGKHACLKCGEEVDAEVFDWKFWPCFKCPSCQQFSKPNPLPF